MKRMYVEEKNISVVLLNNKENGVQNNKHYFLLGSNISGRQRSSAPTRQYFQDRLASF